MTEFLKSKLVRILAVALVLLIGAKAWLKVEIDSFSQRNEEFRARQPDVAVQLEELEKTKDSLMADEGLQKLLGDTVSDRYKQWFMIGQLIDQRTTLEEELESLDKESARLVLLTNVIFAGLAIVVLAFLVLFLKMTFAK